jgi:hypothetical protein
MPHLFFYRLWTFYLLWTFLCAVQSLMSSETSWCSELQATNLTTVRLLSSVRPHMFLQGRIGQEPQRTTCPTANIPLTALMPAVDAVSKVPFSNAFPNPGSWHLKPLTSPPCTHQNCTLGERLITYDTQYWHPWEHYILSSVRTLQAFWIHYSVYSTVTKLNYS